MTRIPSAYLAHYSVLLVCFKRCIDQRDEERRFVFSVVHPLVLRYSSQRRVLHVSVLMPSQRINMEFDYVDATSSENTMKLIIVCGGCILFLMRFAL